MEGHPMLYLYRDPSYKHSYEVFAPYKHLHRRFTLKSWQQKFNKRLLATRIAVKHAIGHTQAL
jgi:hypothetical protein